MIILMLVEPQKQPEHERSAVDTMLSTLWVKKDQRHLFLISSPNVCLFLNFYHHWIQQEIRNNALVMFFTTP